MKQRIFLNKMLTALIIFLYSCSDQTQTYSQKKPITIDIQPFLDMKEEQIKYVYNHLHEIYPNVQIKKAITIPELSYFKPRNRYRADSLIRYLNKRATNGHVIIGLTNKDISSTKGTINDYGLMGLGFCPGKACVASTFRLSKTNNLPQLFIISIHELGHTQGLKHCPSKGCFMRDAEGKNHTEGLNQFCSSCKIHLISKGWLL